MPRRVLLLNQRDDDKDDPSHASPPSPAATTGVEHFFSSIAHEGNGYNEKVVNPLLVHKARSHNEARKRQASSAPGGKYKTGGLARLDMTPTRVRTEEEVVQQYLSREEGVHHGKTRHSALEMSELQHAIDLRRANEQREARDETRRLSQVATARARVKEGEDDAEEAALAQV